MDYDTWIMSGTEDGCNDAELTLEEIEESKQASEEAAIQAQIDNDR